MASLGSLWSGFTGDAQKRRAEDAYKQSSAALQQGWDQGSGYVKDYNQQGNAYLQPFATQGQGANKLYGTFLGLDGADAQRGAFQNYQGADPFRQYNEDNALRAVSRQQNRLGMLDSGNSRYAMSRAMLDRGSQDFDTYMQRLAGMGQQGLGASNALAGFANQTGGLLGQMRTNLGTQQAGNAINYNNSLAAADGMFANNLIKVGGMIISAATGMPVGMGGSPSGGSPAQGMSNNWSGGYTPSQMNSLNGYF